VKIEADEESSDLWGDKRQKVIFAQFIDSQAIAVQTAGRTLNRFKENPRNIEFQLDAKDLDIWTGDLVDIDSRSLPGFEGSNQLTRVQILSVGELTRNASGTRYQIKAIELDFKNRYGYIGPDTLGDYPAESDDNKALYGFIAPDSGAFSDGTNAYSII